MAITPIPVLKYILFVPGKNAKDITQPGYGTDMRVIEQGFNLFVEDIIPNLNQAIAEINEIVTVDIPKFEFGNVAVGSNPPSGTQFVDFSTTQTITTNGTGEASIALTGFSHGYNALITPNWPGLMPSVDIGASTLSTLWLNFQDTTGPYGPNTFSVTIRVVGA
jgi:hypothetical protein